MVSAGEDVGACREKILGDPRRDAEAGRGVFAIDDAEIYFTLREDIREPVVNDLAAGRAYDIANKQDFQIRTFLRKDRPLGSLRSHGAARRGGLVAS